MIYLTHVESPLGEILMSSRDGKRLCGLWFSGQKYEGAQLRNEPDREENPDLPIFKEARRWLELYFEGHDPGFTPLVEFTGSPFRQEVEKILLSIPYGKTTTYGEIARKINREQGEKKISARAVGGAIGHNPICLIIPCHRVIGANGSLTGYAGGIERKKWLLEMEKAAVGR